MSSPSSLLKQLLIIVVVLSQISVCLNVYNFYDLCGPTNPLSLQNFPVPPDKNDINIGMSGWIKIVNQLPSTENIFSESAVQLISQLANPSRTIKITANKFYTNFTIKVTYSCIYGTTQKINNFEVTYFNPLDVNEGDFDWFFLYVYISNSDLEAGIRAYHPKNKTYLTRTILMTSGHLLLDTNYSLNVACEYGTQNFVAATVSIYNFVLYTDMIPYREYIDIQTLMIEGYYPYLRTHLIPRTIEEGSLSVIFNRLDLFERDQYYLNGGLNPLSINKISITPSTGGYRFTSNSFIQSQTGHLNNHIMITFWIKFNLPENNIQSQTLLNIKRSSTGASVTDVEYKMVFNDSNSLISVDLYIDQVNIGQFNLRSYWIKRDDVLWHFFIIGLQLKISYSDLGIAYLYYNSDRIGIFNITLNHTQYILGGKLSFGNINNSSRNDGIQAELSDIKVYRGAHKFDDECVSDNCILCKLNILGIGQDNRTYFLTPRYKCLLCKPGYFLNDFQECVQTCDQGYYRNTFTRSCKKCDLRCDGCTGYSFSNCIACANNYTFLKGNCRCSGSQYEEVTLVEEPNINDFQNLKGPQIQCKPCIDNCSSCIFKPEQCVECNKQKYENNTNTNQCILIALDDGIRTSGEACDTGGQPGCVNGILQPKYGCITPLYYRTLCQQCKDTQCLECTYDQPDKCLKCDTNKYLNPLTGACLQECPDYYYSSQYVCYQCPRNCAKCTSSSLKTCTQCISPYALYNDGNGNIYCQLNCPAYNYKNQQTTSGSVVYYTCEKCVINCQVCTQYSQCSVCDSNYYFDSQQLRCIQCDNSCLKCNGPSSNQCTECRQSLVLKNGVCDFIQCKTGEYLSSDKLSCIKCREPCNKCNGADYCLSCIDNYLLVGYICQSDSCGNGLRYTSAEQCDDGNKQNGDGCSVGCLIELNYVCTGGSLTSKDICTKQKGIELIIEVVSIEQINIKFTRQVKSATLDNTNTNIYIQDLESKYYKCVLSITDQQLFTYQIKCTFQKRFESTYIYIILNDFRQAVDLEGINLERLNYQATLPEYYGLTTQQETVQAAIALTGQVTFTVFFMSLLPLIIAGAANLFFKAVDSFQSLNNLIYLDLDFPQNTESVIKMLNSASFQFLPDIWPAFGLSELYNIEEDNQPTPLRLARNDLQTSFICTISSDIQAIISFIGILYFVRYMVKLNIQNRYLNNFFRKTLSGCEWESLVQIISTAYFNLCIKSFIQLSNMNLNTVLSGFSYIFAVLGLITAVLLPVAFYSLIKRYTSPEHSEQAHKYSALFSDYQNLGNKKYFFVVVLTKKFLHSFFIIVLTGESQFQIVGTLYIISSLIQLILKPHVATLDLIRSVASDLLIGIIPLILLGLRRTRSNYSETEYFEEGWPSIIIVFIVILGNIFLIIVIQVQFFYKKYKLAKGGNSHQKNINNNNNKKLSESQQQLPTQDFQNPDNSYLDQQHKPDQSLMEKASFIPDAIITNHNPNYINHTSNLEQEFQEDDYTQQQSIQPPLPQSDVTLHEYFKKRNSKISKKAKKFKKNITKN